VGARLAAPSNIWEALPYPDYNPIFDLLLLLPKLREKRVRIRAELMP